MKFYYARPRPEHFVEEVRRLFARGLTVDSEAAFPASVFLGRVMAANPTMVPGWFNALSDLQPSELPILEAAARFSRVSPMRDDRAAGTAPSSDDPPDLLEMPIDHPVVLDALWAHYFATGDTLAVRRIVSALEYMSDLGAAASYSNTKQTDADKARALRDGIFQAASWSLESLMREHLPLKSFCGDLTRSGDLTPNERCALAIVLAKIDPTAWKVHIDPATNHVSIGWSESAVQPPAPKKRWWKPW